MGICLSLTAYTSDDLQAILNDETAQNSSIDQAKCDLDKIWGEIHYLLTQSHEPQDSLLSNAIFLPHTPFDDMGLSEEEMEDIMEEMGFAPATYLLAEEIPAIAAELSKQEFEKLWENAQDELSIDDKDWLRDVFTELCAFYQTAAENQHGVLGLLY